MDSLRLKNYRCFDDTGRIEIKPLNFLVGANSSGKSSFLKFFPLLKQSMGVRRHGTFLWLSNDVDFKDFKNVVKEGEDCIEIEFTIKNIMPYVDAYDKDESVSINISLRIESSDDKYDYLSKLCISFDDQNILINIDKDGEGQIYINGKDVLVNTKEKAIANSTLSFLPILFFSNEDDDFNPTPAYYRKQLDQILNSRNGERTDLYNRLIGRLKLASQKDLKRFINDAVVDNDGNMPYNFELLNIAYLMLHLNDVILAVNQYVSRFSSSINYVRPLRATTERYYRFQNYTIDEIDSDGKNLAMFLYNLPEKRLEAFQNWTKEIFGFEINVRSSEGHIQLEIKEQEKPVRNMVDVGFGYTQILPTIAIIWNALYQRTSIMRGRRSIPKLIVIEQPELHLHPRMQGLFADMLVKVIAYAKRTNADLRLIIETHSETIINRVGEAIAKEEFVKDDVNVYLFNAKNEGFDKSIETSSYSGEGYLLNWPYGFFSDYVY